MRWFGQVVVASVLLLAPACAMQPRAAPPPVAPLGRVSEAHAIRVRFRPEPHALRLDVRGGEPRRADTKRLLDNTYEAIENFNLVLAATLRRAGYEVTEDGPCDVHVVRELYFDTEPRQARHGSFSLNEIVRVVFRVYDTKGNEIDRFELLPTEGTVPAGAPERLAVDLVNAMLQSPKVASYTETRKTKSGPVDKPPADEATAPAAGADD